MNFYDSERIESVLEPSGFELSNQMEDSDLVILNTCHIREKAAEKVYSELGRINIEKERLKQQGRRMVIAVAGCVAQAEGKEIISRAPYVDIVIGTQATNRLPKLVANAFKYQDITNDNSQIDLALSTNEKFDMLTDDYESKGVTAFVTIQEGCDKFCTYCVVPYTRGAEISRNASEIINESKSLVEKGVKDITLLGQNVNAYHGRGLDFESWTMADLVNKLAEIDGLERIRYVTSHPQDMQDDLINSHGSNKKMMPYLHLPIQSGSDKILKAMNRKHSVEKYMESIDKLRIICPDIALSSDFIVGFPGETEEDFMDTMKIVEEVKYAHAYSFIFSPRPGTPAALMPDDVPMEVKKERLARLQDLISRQQVEFNKSKIDQVLPVLFEKEGRHDKQYIGRSPYLHAVHVTSEENIIGELLNVKIISSSQNSLSGIIC